MKKPSLKVSVINSWYKTQKLKRKEKEEQERNLEPTSLKIITFFITIVAMALGMSFLPLFPQPLPILLAILVAFVTFKKPQFGMPIGGVVIGIGLMFHLAKLYFISFLGNTQVRLAFIIIWMVLFVGVPLVSKRYKSVLAIDFGILAVTMLFFSPLYSLAIPLILASAVFFRKYVVFTTIYFVLISVPLQIVQYFQYTVLSIVRSDWWIEAGSSPPLLVPLTSISKDLTSSMSQFRLYDTSKVIYDIAGQTTWIPDWRGRTIGDALTQYLDSIPGILLFVVIVAGLAVTLIFFTRLLVKEGAIGATDKFFPCFTATLAAAIFFILISALQIPLAFTADVSPITMVSGILATLILTVPVMFIDYTPKQSASLSLIKDKAQALKVKLDVFEAQLDNVVKNIPVIVTSPQGKATIIKDSLDETLKKLHLRIYDQTELNQKFVELDQLNKDKDVAEAELNAILSEYQIFANCEFSNWVGKLKDAGLDLKTSVDTFYLNEMPQEKRIEAIKQILEAGRALVKEVIVVADPIYEVMRSLYDPALPEKSRAVEFASDKLKKKESPWIAVEALYNSLNNWRRQYGAEILTSMKFLQSSLLPIANLSNQDDALPLIFGENTHKVLRYAEQVQELKGKEEKVAEKKKIEILDVIALKDDVQGFLIIVNDILTTLYTGLINEEKAIDDILPTKDYMWEKNPTLHERLKKATEILGTPSNYRINQIMEKLPTYVSYVNEAVQTLTLYKDQKEFLLNYPIAETVIEERLRQKKKLSPQDLPFQTQFAAEYLRLYYSQRFGDYSFDKETNMLTERK